MSDILALEAVILDRLIEAQVVMRLAKVRGAYPGQPRTFWPDSQPGQEEQWEAALQSVALKLTDAEKKARNMARPDAAAISRMEEPWNWLSLVKEDQDRKALAVMVFCYAYKIQPKRILDKIGLAKSTAHYRLHKALADIMLSVCNRMQNTTFASELLVGQFRPKSGIYSDKMRTLAA
ncbi:DUF6362 family protein [Flexibacterium corallicola]|uniref:DUF6362 family protein n=1 Tax=Flexibacterium corallicola TaxID=3037259 RepID=UPI00286F268C|nr:DUF6362 family protein [Pseudovibrio sp. M1P-2-3]